MAGSHPLIDKSFEDIKSYLEQNPSYINDQEISVLWALKNLKCSKDIVELFLQHGASIETEDDFGDTPLLYAVKYRLDEDVIIELVEKGANVNVQDEDGYSPFCLALNSIPSKKLVECFLKADYYQSCMRHETELRCFLNYGVSIDKPGVTEEVMKLLIESVDSVAELDSNGRSPLCLALSADIGTREVKLLLSKGASFRDCKMHDSPMVCVTYGLPGKLLEANFVELLLNKGVSVEEVNNEDCTTLQIALRYARYETAAIKILLDRAGMKDIANIKHAVFGNLLHFAVTNYNCKFRIVKFLLHNGVRCDEINSQGRTPLHEITEHGCSDLRIIKLLLKSGSPVNLRCTKGLTPLSLAVKNGMQGNVFEMLFDAGAFINGLTNTDGIPLIKQALQQSSYFGIDLCKILLKWLLIENPNFHIKSLIEGHKDNVELTRFAEECILDIKRMESVIIGQDFTLSDFIKGNLLGNVFVDSKPKLNCGLDELLRTISNHRFLNYFDVISSRISKLLLTEKLQHISVYTRIDDPCIGPKTVCDNDCSLKIAKYLTKQELLCLIMAFYFNCD